MRDLVPNQSYVFAVCAFDDATGQPVVGSGIGPTTAAADAVLAATPLPLTLLWVRSLERARHRRAAAAASAAAAAIFNRFVDRPLRRSRDDDGDSGGGGGGGGGGGRGRGGGGSGGGDGTSSGGGDGDGDGSGGGGGDDDQTPRLPFSLRRGLAKTAPPAVLRGLVLATHALTENTPFLQRVADRPTTLRASAAGDSDPAAVAGDVWNDKGVRADQAKLLEQVQKLLVRACVSTSVRACVSA